MSPRQALRRLADGLAGTALDRAIRRAATGRRRDFLFCWNRGMGDVALCLVPIFMRIRQEVPGARITIVTRPELTEPFAMTDADAIVAVPGLARGVPIAIGQLRALPGIDVERYSAVFEDPDVNRWLRGRRTEFRPALKWNSAWDTLAERIPPSTPDRFYIGAHVSAETRQYYSYAKDWETESWRELMARLDDVPGARWLLFGQTPEPRYERPNVIDLRGDTGFLEMASIIRNRVRLLIAPDSGVLATAYYLDARFPLDVVSLWSDPRQGILLQGCPSPNPLLRHVPLVGRDEQARNIPVDEVLAEARAALDRAI
jgi:ADP-heptose:LPS heptosyltransferase